MKDVVFYGFLFSNGFIFYNKRGNRFLFFVYVFLKYLLGFSFSSIFSILALILFPPAWWEMYISNSLLIDEMSSEF